MNPGIWELDGLREVISIASLSLSSRSGREHAAMARTAIAIASWQLVLSLASGRKSSQAYHQRLHVPDEAGKHHFEKSYSGSLIFDQEFAPIQDAAIGAPAEIVTPESDAKVLKACKARRMPIESLKLVCDLVPALTLNIDIDM